jgi:glycosyltransferase involved in cell wall biosynthesis
VRSDAWTTLPDGTRVYYCSKKGANRTALAILIAREDFDIAYFNSVFSLAFTLSPLRLVRRLKPSARLILAPRGMLGAGALQIKSLKKKLFLSTARLAGWFRNIRWHVSSEQEAGEVRAVFGSDCEVCVASNLSLPELHGWQSRLKVPGEVRFYFLSRISPKKNLLPALRLLAKTDPASHIRFDIFGPIDDAAYGEQCLEALRHLPPHVEAIYHGPLPPKAISTRLADSHFLLLPTQHENFGHVVLEAFAASCPVILSDQTPWRNLTAQKLGWDLPPDHEAAWIEAIATATQMDTETYRQWSAAAYAHAEAYAGSTASLETNRRVFLDA